MARIPDVKLDACDPPVRAVLEAQSRTWGAPLANHLIYARLPPLFRGVRAMWGALDACGQIARPLQALLNRRVAFLNGCTF